MRQTETERESFIMNCSIYGGSRASKDTINQVYNRFFCRRTTWRGGSKRSMTKLPTLKSTAKCLRPSETPGILSPACPACSSCSFPFHCVLTPPAPPKCPLYANRHDGARETKICADHVVLMGTAQLMYTYCVSSYTASSSSTLGNPFFLRCHYSALMCRYVEGGFGLDMFDDPSTMS